MAVRIKGGPFPAGYHPGVHPAVRRVPLERPSGGRADAGVGRIRRSHHGQPLGREVQSIARSGGFTAANGPSGAAGGSTRPTFGSKASGSICLARWTKPARPSIFS